MAEASVFSFSGKMLPKCNAGSFERNGATPRPIAIETAYAYTVQSYRSGIQTFCVRGCCGDVFCVFRVQFQSTMRPTPCDVFC